MIRSLATAVALMLVALTGATHAQETFPARTITIVNPFPPGGLADLTGRPLAASMEKILKQPVVIVNKSGASGAVGMQSVAVAKPDGYTILTTVPAITILPEVDRLFGRTPTFTRDQFVPLARINADPVVVVSNTEQPWQNLKDMLETVKRKPNEIIFSSAGVYSATHLPMEMLLHAAGGLKMRHLPTAGGGPAATAVLGNHAQLTCATTGVASGHVKSGKWRALAITSATRHPQFPDVPTLKELGYDVDYALWIAYFAPKATPPAATKALREAIRQAVEDPTFKNAMEKIGTPIAYQDADDFQKYWDVDSVRLGAAIKHIGKVDTPK